MSSRWPFRHPPGRFLALYAGRDLPFWQRWWIDWHAGQCEPCSVEIEEYRHIRDGVEMLARIPPGLDWERLASEMKGNIRVGVEAGACIGSRAEAPSALGWRAAVALASLTVIIVSGWIVFFPRPALPDRTAAEAPVVIEASAEGVALKQGSGGLTLRSGDAGAAVTFTVNAQGSVAARYVDGETGYVTISHVYGE